MTMLPIGIEFFDEIRTKDYYYVDKTKLIEELILQGNKISLFTRPRRFGKTLNMSMLKCFFEIGTNKDLFDGLYISNNEELCNKYMGKYPVLFITLKGVEGLTFEAALAKFKSLISMEAERFSFLKDSDNLTDNEKERYRFLIDVNGDGSTMNDSALIFSLKTLCELLYKHYGQKVIVLIDEYDVPLDKAFQYGYYKEMVSLIRGVLGEVLKTNDYLEFGVLTGCLRVSKESIFTGLNNFNVLSIVDSLYDEEFGFTQEEVENLLKFYNLESNMDTIKQWYDGYHFGKLDVYCPWDVVNHVNRLRNNPNQEPMSYWINSSGNGLVKRFINKADRTTRDELERLLAGETIDKNVRLELTYDEIDNSIDNLWSVLFTTGYLTYIDKSIDGTYKLKIPNKEIKEVYRDQINIWFKEKLKDDNLSLLWDDFSSGNESGIENILTGIMNKSISVLDPKGDDVEKEKFYHALLAGILIGNGQWNILSNRESGDGYPDIMVEMEDPNKGLIIEVKSVDKITLLDDACKTAMNQILSKRYDQYLKDEGRIDVWGYGISFYKKRCKVVSRKL